MILVILGGCLNRTHRGHEPVACAEYPPTRASTPTLASRVQSRRAPGGGLVTVLGDESRIVRMLIRMFMSAQSLAVAARSRTMRARLISCRSRPIVNETFVFQRLTLVTLVTVLPQPRR
jgi:hypothetical protein